MNLSGQIANRIAKRKQTEGPDLRVYTSANLVQTLSKHDLVDALRLKILRSHRACTQIQMGPICRPLKIIAETTTCPERFIAKGAIF